MGLFGWPWLRDIPFPFVEDIANRDTFCGFLDWLDERGCDSWGALGPAAQTWDMPVERHLQQAWQPGAFSSRFAPDPLVSPGLDPDDHFAAACALQNESHPFDAPTIIELDARYAIEWAIGNRKQLRVA